jgi:hypothetical protein
MQKQLLTIAFIGIIIIGAVTAGGYYLGKVIQNPKTTPSPSDLPLINESVELPKSSLPQPQLNQHYSRQLHLKQQQ